MRKIIHTFLFLLSFASAFAQECNFTLTGKITDKDDGEPLEFTIVSVKEINFSTNSNEEGEFKIENLCAGDYTIRIIHLGCADTSIKVSVSKNTRVNFKLPHSLHELADVEIIERVDYKPTQTIDNIKQEEIDKAKGKTLADALKGSAGITTLNTGASISKPMIHGLQGYRILILNNGIRQEGQQWGNEHAPEIDPFMAKKIRIVKGAASVRYGSDAIAGAILLEPDALPDTAAVTGEINAIGLSNGRAGVVSGIMQGSFEKVKGFAWRVQGTIKQGGNMKTPEYYLKNTGVQEKNFSYTLGYHRKKVGIELFYSQFNSTIGVFSGAHIGNLTDLKSAFASAKPQDSLAPFSYYIGRPKQEIEHELVKSKFHVHTGMRSRLYVTAAYQYNIRKEFDKHIPKNSSSYDTTKADLDYRITSKTFDVAWEHDNINSFRGTYGASYMNQTNVYLGRYLIPNFINNTWGAFAIERYIKHKYELELGVRYDEKYLQSYYYKGNDLQSPYLKFKNLSVNTGWIYKPTHQLHFFTNLSTAWRVPAVNELYSNGLHHGSASIEKGDEKIEQERCYSFISTGSFKNKRIEADITVYSNYFKGFIYLSPGTVPELTIKGAFPVFYYKQTDALISGIDYKINVEFVKNTFVQVKGMFLRGQDLTNNDWLVWMPSDRVEASLTYKLKDTKRFKKTYASASFEYITKQWRIPQNSDYAAPPNSYYLVGFDVATKIKVKNQEIGIGISGSNVTNKIYRDYLDRFRYYTNAVGTNIQFRLNVPFTIFDKKTQ